jgi:hypothetical protein
MKTRSILIILLTLIIGFVLGMLTSAQIRYHRLKPVRVYFSEERFRDGFYKAIQPDGQQKAKIDLVLDKYAKLNSELQSNFRKELENNMKEFRKELDLNLTKEQIARLKDMDDRRQEMIRQNHKVHEGDTLDSRPQRRRFEDHGPFQEGRRPPFSDRDSAKLPDNK